MTNKFLKLLIVFCLSITFYAPITTAQEKKDSKFINIESQVKDTYGNPVAGAKIVSSDGTKSSTSNSEGVFSLRVSTDAFLLIEADGYETLRVDALNNLDTNEGIIISKSEFFYGSNDDVNIPFGIAKRGDIIGAVTVINPAEFQKYDNTHQISDALLGRVPGLLGASNIRGFGGALILVDGTPRSIDNINLEEVEQITVLRDVNSVALYGSQALNGVILITSKKGEAFKNTIKVIADYGTKLAKAYPEYLNSADYMGYYNEARINDGLAPRFDSATISNFRNGNPYIYPDINYFSSEYVRKFANTSNINTSFSGGADNAVYFTSIGWTNSGSLLNFGEALNDRNDRFNIRGNIDFKVNDFISSYVSTSGIFDVSRSSRVNYWSAASSNHPNQFSPFIPLSLIDNTNEELMEIVNARRNDIDGEYLIGGNIEFLEHPFGTIHKGGYNNFVRRNFQFDNGINVDLNQWIEGLSFHTNLGFDMYTSYNQSFNNEYSVYQATWNPVSDSITALTKFGEDKKSGVQTIGSTDFRRSFSFNGRLDYNKTINGIHKLNAVLLGYANSTSFPAIIQPDRFSHLGVRLAYSYKKKYLIDFSGAYPNSVKLPENNKTGFAPTFGLAWVISSESFLSDIKQINYLKFKTSAGIINSDLGINGYYFYDNVFTTSSAYSWADGSWSNQGFRSSFGGNSSLFFEKRKELNIGLEGSFFDHLLSFDANVFSNVFSDVVDKTTTLYPDFYSDFVGYENFNKNGYKGGEVGMSLYKSIGDFSVTFSGNLLYIKTEVLQRNEIYANDYQYRKGKPVNATFGLESDGFFMSQDEIDNHAFQVFGEVKPGDIKYVDQNGNGIIDSDDRIFIGQSQAPLSYGLSLILRYKNLRLFIIGNGRNGAVSMRNSDYYWVDGDDKYSKFVLNRWTEETKLSAEYPRLSSITNTNNFQSSDFWLYKTDYLYLDRIQLSYELPSSFTNKIGLNSLSLFVNGSGLLRISKNKDILDLNVGGEPQYSYYTLGASVSF
jgi:TonB-linked SusC/RagA family outer membrane protein